MTTTSDPAGPYTEAGAKRVKYWRKRKIPNEKCIVVAGDNQGRRQDEWAILGQRGAELKRLALAVSRTKPTQSFQRMALLFSRTF
jgi:hypothetical protein